MEDGWFTDDLVGEPYKDPVMAEDGFIYERAFIEEWFQKGGVKSPKTLLPMGTALFYPFEYYQLREAWAQRQGVSLPAKPKKFGRLERPPTSTLSPGMRAPFQLRMQVTVDPIYPVTINYYSSDEEDYFSPDEFPPLALQPRLTRPPVVRDDPRRAPSSRTRL